MLLNFHLEENSRTIDNLKYKTIYKFHMIKYRSQTIILTAIAMMTSLTLLLASTTLNGHSQGLEIPQFKPKFPAATEDQDSQSSNTQNTVKKPLEEIAMKVQLEEHENEYLDDYYQVSDFAFVASNTSKLCPAGNCEYEIEAGEMSSEYTAGERSLDGKFKVDTGVSKKIMNMRASWETVEERESADGEIIRVIEGTLGIGKNEFSPEHQYQINGTLSPDGDEYLLAVKGMK